MSVDTASGDLGLGRRRATSRRYGDKKLVVAIVLSLVVFCTIFALRDLGFLYGLWVLPVFSLLLALIPVSPHLSGRIVWTLVVLFGIVPLLWWIPLSWAPTARSTLLLSVVAATVVFCSLGLPFGRGTGMRLLPRIRLVDVLPAAAGAVSIFVYFHELTVRRIDDAMSLMLLAWDNASHYNIFHMQRVHGTVLPLVGLAGDGSRWSFSDYPQGFHSALVMVYELARNNGPQDWEADVIGFVNFSAIINIAVLVLVVAAVCSLPRLRRNPMVGAPVAVFVASGWLFGPGALASMHGFSNFFFSTGLAAAAVVLLHSMRRVLDPLPLIAAGACAAGIMQNWIPLLVFLVPSVLGVFFATPKGRWMAMRRDVACAVVVVALIGTAGVAATSQLMTLKAQGILFATGGVPAMNYGFLVALLLLLAAIAVYLSGSKSVLLASTRRAQWSIGTVWAGLALTLAMATAQLIEQGTVSYYMQKFSIALVLMAMIALAIAASELLERRYTLGQATVLGGSPRMAVVSLIISLGITQIFGFVLPLRAVGLPPSSASSEQMELQVKALSQGSEAGDRMLEVVRRSWHLPGPVIYLTTHNTDFNVFLAQQWFDGLRSSYSEHSWNRSLRLNSLRNGPGALEQVVTDLLREDPSVQFVVDPENQAALDQILTKLG